MKEGGYKPYPDSGESSTDFERHSCLRNTLNMLDKIKDEAFRSIRSGKVEMRVRFVFTRYGRISA